MTKIIVVYSGGLDSFTLLNEAIRSGKAVSALSFDYGQKHSKELHFVEKFCASSHTVVVNLRIFTHGFAIHPETNIMDVFSQNLLFFFFVLKVFPNDSSSGNILS